MIILGILALLEKFNDPDGTAYVWFAVFVLPVNSSVNPVLYTFSTPKVGTQMGNQLRVNVSKNRRLSQNRGHSSKLFDNFYTDRVFYRCKQNGVSFVS